MMALAAYIAAGGKSSRFGADKARALLNGRPLIVGVADQLGSQVGPITAIADVAGKYADLAIRTIADLSPGRGPLSALEAALIDAGPDQWLLLVSCDLVKIRPQWIQQLCAARAPALSAIAFRGDYWEPLLALYHTQLLAEVQRRLAAHVLSMQGLLDTAQAKALPRPYDWPKLAQINTQADWLQAQAAEDTPSSN